MCCRKMNVLMLKCNRLRQNCWKSHTIRSIHSIHTVHAYMTFNYYKILYHYSYLLDQLLRYEPVLLSDQEDDMDDLTDISASDDELYQVSFT